MSTTRASSKSLSVQQNPLYLVVVRYDGQSHKLTINASTAAGARSQVRLSAPTGSKIVSVSKIRKSSNGVKIVYNRLLGGWYIVTGPHHTPIGGRYNSKAEAQAALDKRKQNPKRRIGPKGLRAMIDEDLIESKRKTRAGSTARRRQIRDLDEARYNLAKDMRKLGLSAKEIKEHLREVTGPRGKLPNSAWDKGGYVPETYYIVEWKKGHEHQQPNITKHKSIDYDKLQVLADQHNERVSYGEWFVLSAKDVAGIRAYKKKNGSVKKWPNSAWNKGGYVVYIFTNYRGQEHVGMAKAGHVPVTHEKRGRVIYSGTKAAADAIYDRLKAEYDAKRFNPNWIQSAHLEAGALTRKAKRAGMSVAKYAEKVLSGAVRVTEKTKREAQLAKTLRGLHKNPRKSAYYYVDAPKGMTSHAIRAYNAVAKGMSSKEFYFGHNKHLVGDYDQYKATVERYPKRLFRLPKQRNSPASDFATAQHQKLLQNAERFQGHLSGEKRRVQTSDLAPRSQYRLGLLKQLIVKRPNGDKVSLQFDGDSYLGGDAKNNLWISGKDATIANLIRANHLPKGNGLHHIGKLLQVDYVTNKSHIGNGETIYFYHKAGEVTRENPELYVDANGYPIIIGGNYDIWDVGIVN